MKEYKTHYFGTFYVDDEDEEIVLETILNINNAPKAVSILVSSSILKNDKIKECIAILDDYSRLEETGKIGIIKYYHEKGVLSAYINKKLKVLGKEIFGDNQGLKAKVKKIDPPSIVLEYKDEKIIILLTYNLDEESEDFIIIELESHNGYRLKDIKIFEEE
jgi:hypothetical protein